MLPFPYYDDSPTSPSLSRLPHLQLWYTFGIVRSFPPPPPRPTFVLRALPAAAVRPVEGGVSLFPLLYRKCLCTVF